MRAFLLFEVGCQKALGTMKFTPEELASIHKRCFANEPLLASCTQAGCFDCLSVFPASSVKHWIEDDPHRTAECPKCGSDTVLPDDGTFEFSEEMLQAMSERYMAGSAKEGAEVKVYTSYSEYAKDFENGEFEEPQ